MKGFSSILTQVMVGGLLSVNLDYAITFFFFNLIPSDFGYHGLG
jgi:hypothetical protein